MKLGFLIAMRNETRNEMKLKNTFIFRANVTCDRICQKQDIETNKKFKPNRKRLKF